MFFQISEIRDVVFNQVPAWAQGGVMAAVPWKDATGWHLLGQGFTTAEPVTRSSLFLAHGNDPFTFAIDPTPLLVPGTEGSEDELGVEDPTIVPCPCCGRAILFSRVRRMRAAEAARFRPPTEPLGVIVSLGIVHHAFDGGTLRVRMFFLPRSELWWEETIDTCKKGEMLLRDHPDAPDILFYEFADGRRSRIAARTFCVGEAGDFQWRGGRLWLHPIIGTWFDDHVSTGPILRVHDVGVMFFNGRSRNRVWAIGEVTFNPRTLEIKSFSQTPLITPPRETRPAGQRIAFASGLWMESDRTVYLYHHIADRRIRCAVGTAP